MKLLHLSNRLVWSGLLWPPHPPLTARFCWQFQKGHRFHGFCLFFSDLVESLPILTIQEVNDNVTHFPEIKASILHNTMKFLNRKRKRKNLIREEVWKYTLKNMQERNKGIWHPLEIIYVTNTHEKSRCYQWDVQIWNTHFYPPKSENGS